MIGFNQRNARLTIRGESMKGKVKWFDGGKGYGFIKGDDGKEYLLYYSAIIGSEADMQEDAAVEFEPADTPKGPQAADVRRTDRIEPHG